MSSTFTLDDLKEGWEWIQIISAVVVTGFFLGLVYVPVALYDKLVKVVER